MLCAKGVAVPLSKDPAARERQLRNLKPSSALKHGARSEALIQESARAILAELEKTYPSESPTWLALQSRRLAKIGRLTAYLESRPSEVLNQKTGRLNPAGEQEEALTRAVLADFERAGQRKREAGGKPAAGLEALRAKGAQIISEREANGGE
jgi:hypothetical protein